MSQGSRSRSRRPEQEAGAGAGARLVSHLITVLREPVAPDLLDLYHQLELLLLQVRGEGDCRGARLPPGLEPGGAGSGRAA